jgi:hypothetical protein
MSRFWRAESEDGSDVQICFHCPGCRYGHSFRIKGQGPIWEWNGDLEKATFSPSLLVNQHRPESRCHSFVRDGQIQYLDDCFHSMKNTTIDIPDSPTFADSL